MYRKPSPPEKLVPASISPRPESIELARAQYLQGQRSPQSIQKSPESLLNRSKKQYKDLRSTLRTSESGDLEPNADATHAVVRTARSISSSLRNRFKRAFSKPQLSLPPQQLNASRLHFGDAAFGNAGNGGFDSYIQDNVIDSSRASFYEDPWHEKVEDDDLRRLSNMAPVNRSNGDLTDTSKSRVTSWTDTTSTGSLREIPLERKRLSVIQEDGGPHQPSSSAGTHIGGVTIFRKPLPLPPGQQPDPQRLYSALVRRMNQESERRATERPVQDTIAEQEEFDLNHSTIRAVSSSTDAQNSASTDHTKPSARSRAVLLGCTPSEESIYSRKGDGDPDPSYNKKNMSELTIDPTTASENKDFADTYRRLGHANPYLESNATLASRSHCEQLSNTVDAQGNLSQFRRSSIHDMQFGGTSSDSLCKNKIGIVKTGNPGKPAAHVREHAQFAESPPRKAFDEPDSRHEAVATHSDIDKRHTGTRTPSPLAKAPDQLSVAKKRFPLLNVKSVNKNNTPVPSRNSSLTRSQSGLLQQASGDQTNDQGQGKHEKAHKIAASLRKISAENVANVLRGKESLVLGHMKPNQENRPSGEPEHHDFENDEQVAVSTPGPAYLAMRSGNSGSGERRDRKTTSKHTISDSPTELVKATLSARLSRPFNMDIPELNRPFDSMYLGKREVGFNDTTGGRLSVAKHTHTYGCRKRRSFDRGPGGYGGLGPSPFDGQAPEETALPQIPTPESQCKTSGKKIGASLGTKRMVSNFLRSRRKGGNSTEDGSSHDHGAEEHDFDTPVRSSPLFI